MNPQQRPFNPIQYIPVKDKESILNLPISTLSAVAHEPLPKGGNHWSIYLTTSDTDYVRLDMTPSYTIPTTVIPGGSKGILIVNRVDDLRVRTATKVVRHDVRGGSKVSEFVDSLVKEKRYLYEFNDSGQGCRFWVYHQIDLFWDEGWVVDGGQAEEARRAILIMYPQMMRYGLVVGEYYS